MLSAVGLRVAGLSLPAVVFWWCEGAQGHSLLCLRKKLHQEATCKAVIFRWAFCLWGYFASSRRAFAHALSLGLLRVLSPRVRARTPRRARAPQRDARFPPRVRRSVVLAFRSCAAARFAARGGDSSSRSCRGDRTMGSKQTKRPAALSYGGSASSVLPAVLSWRFLWGAAR